VVSLTFQYAGENLFNETVSIILDASTGGIHYGNSKYYGDGNYYSASFSQRLSRKEFQAPSQGNEFQVQVSVEGTGAFDISEVGIRFDSAS